MGKKFRAYDKATGTVIAEIELPSGTTGAPMTYMHKGKQYIVVPIGAQGSSAEFVALGLAEQEADRRRREIEPASGQSDAGHFFSTSAMNARASRMTSSVIPMCPLSV